MLQFASVQDLVQFFTLHPFEIEVKLRPMNVTDHYNKCKKQIQKGVPAVHSVQVSDRVYHIYDPVYYTNNYAEFSVDYYLVSFKLHAVF